MSPSNGVINRSESAVGQPNTSLGVTTRVAVFDEADTYSGSLPGVTLDVIRTGRGHGPNVVKAHVGDNVTFASALVQFPVLGRTTVADDTILVALLTNAPPSSRWCGIDVETNSMLLYGPGAEHTGRSPAGLSYAFASVDVRALEESAERNGLNIRVPQRGQVSSLDSTSDTASVRQLLRSANHSFANDDLPGLSEDILHAVGELMSQDRLVFRDRRRRVIDSVGFVNSSIRYVSEVGAESSAMGVLRTPSISELCSVVHVSERRLRNAFYDTFGMAPLRYFRLRSMTAARSQLLDVRSRKQSVLQIAHGLGYDNPSRFASYYTDVFGENPGAAAAYHSPLGLARSH